MRVAARLAAVAALALAAVNSAAQGQRPVRFEELAKIRRLGSFSVSPDGRQIAYTVSTPDVAANTSRSSIWVVPASGGEPRRLTAGDKKDFDPRFSPD
jgi:Tol biopolymer transport system component